MYRFCPGSLFGVTGYPRQCSGARFVCPDCLGNSAIILNLLPTMFIIKASPTKFPKWKCCANLPVDPLPEYTSAKSTKLGQHKNGGFPSVWLVISWGQLARPQSTIQSHLIDQQAFTRGGLGRGQQYFTKKKMAWNIYWLNAEIPYWYHSCHRAGLSINT